MFSSLDTNGYDLFDDPFNPHHTKLLPSFTTHIQSPSSQHHNNFSVSSPLSPYFLDDSLLISQILLQQQQEGAANVVESPRKVHKKGEQKEKCVDGTTSEGGEEKISRRRTGKRDRHSKICTAQGPRDRRMRLSLQIARKFFDLQDMLGFDKASKTIEWLFSKSKASIKQVKESVAASGGGGGGDYEHLQFNEKSKDETLNVAVPNRRAKTVESSCKAKESRERARKRARERTMTKMKMRLSSGLVDTSKTFSDPHQETRKIKITGGAQVEGGNQERSTTNVNMVGYQMDSVSIIEKFLGLTNESSSSSIYRDTDESYAILSSRRGTSNIGLVTPREHNINSTESVDEERNPNSSFYIYDYLCY